jgi:ABC-type multidrug transport system fused ATPase/permease subunit
VGAGKSSFLQALLGDLYKMKGEVIIRGSCAYVAQSPWVMNATVRENIIFGHRDDPHFYNKTVRACALLDDFATLPDGDQTEVGERGISLSGGQKARLTLARAVYARADIVSFDSYTRWQPPAPTRALCLAVQIMQCVARTTNPGVSL